MKIGDVVQLKSGGPNMTIDGFLSEEHDSQYERGLGIALLKKRWMKTIHLCHAILHIHCYFPFRFFFN